MKDKLTIATRDSRLATVQAEIVRGKLKEAGISAELLYVSSKGDRDRVSSLDVIGGDGLFVRKLEEEVCTGKADLAVHSAKDLPFELMEGLGVFSVPDAGDARDVLIMKKDRNPGNELLIGSSSQRRSLQYQNINPDVHFRNLRGNVTTRLKKLDSGEYDGIILAKAGIDRLDIGLQEYECRIFEPREMVPAACQGLLAAECRKDDGELISLLRSISVPGGMERMEAERYLFKSLGAKCSLPVGVYADIKGDEISISVFFNGVSIIKKGKTQDYRELSQSICEELGL